MMLNDEMKVSKHILQAHTTTSSLQISFAQSIIRLVRFDTIMVLGEYLYRILMGHSLNKWLHLSSEKSSFLKLNFHHHHLFLKWWLWPAKHLGNWVCLSPVRVFYYNLPSFLLKIFLALFIRYLLYNCARRDVSIACLHAAFRPFC